MKRLFFIIDNKKKYSSISISGYKKQLLIKAYNQSILTKNFYNSLYFAFEILASGYYRDFWKHTFIFLSEYIHVLSPNLPRQIIDRYNFFKDLEKKMRKKKLNLLEMRNILEIQKSIVFIVKNFTETNHKHTSFFIKPAYNNHKKIIIRNLKTTVPIFKRLKLLIHLVINNKINHKGNTAETLHEIFNLIGQLMAIDAAYDKNFHQQYPINLYHHERSQINEEIVGLYWNILLKVSKINKNIWTQIAALYEIYNSKFAMKDEKQTYHLLNALYYFIYQINDEPLIAINKGDVLFIQRFYTNIQKAIDSQCKRIDHIEIDDKKKSKKNSKKKKETIRKKNNELVKVSDKIILQNHVKVLEAAKQVPVQKILKQNQQSVAKPIEPVDIANQTRGSNIPTVAVKKPEDDFNEFMDDPYFASILDTGEVKDNGTEIDIKIEGEKLSPEEEILGFIFDFDNAPTQEESYMNKIKYDKEPEIRKEIKMPASFNPEKGMRKPLSGINKYG
jgi:hypothetical protein